MLAAPSTAQTSLTPRADASASTPPAETQEPRVADVFPPDLDLVLEPVILRVEAHAGRPFGIGRLNFRLRRGDEMVLRTGSVLLTEQDNRVFYPVMTKSAVKTFLQTVTGRDAEAPDDQHTILFLFRGEQPLHLRLEGTAAATEVVEVETRKPRRFQRFAQLWWREMNNMTTRQLNWGDYPGVIETYLTAMLSHRMGLDEPKHVERNKDQLAETFDLLFDVETLRTDEIQRAMTGRADNSTASLPLPPPIGWQPTQIENVSDDLAIEPVAFCIPEECFYLRFGTWQNQLWLQRLMEEYGGDLSRMIQLRGFKQQIQNKFLDQLAIESTELDQLFGGNLIDDVAVIGMDAYIDEGAAIGVLLHASQSAALNRNLLNKRAKFAKDQQQLGANLVDIDYDGTTIQYLSTPDNRYRSFYVVKKSCHLVTTSLRMAQRFVDAARGEQCLGNNEEFRWARSRLPLDRNDTVFVYLSTPFFQQLLSPHYQIELRRRNRVISDMQMLEAARLSASHEGYDFDEIDSLIQNGFLPEKFGVRPDDGVTIVGSSSWSDSIRGRRGFFTPIADMKLEAVTQDEFDWFNETAEFFTNNVRSIDPMVIAIKRYEHESKKNVERVIFDARVAPFGQEKYGWLMNMLGPSLQHQIASSPDDILSFQASLAGGSLNSASDDHHIFAAIQDQMDPSIDLSPTSALKALQMLREAPAYIGAWPKPGYLDWLPGLGGQPDAEGFTYSRILNLWRMQWKDFSVVSFDRDRLERLKLTLAVIPSERPAQIRLTIGDLRESQIKTWVNSVNYRRSWETSIANVRVLNMLTQQFGIPPEIARAVAEKMLNVDLVCALGGKYELYQIHSGRKLWASTSWPSFTAPRQPPDYVAPILNWFRGAEVEVSKSENQFAVHGFLDIERDPQESKMKLPSFDMFKGFGNIFGVGSEGTPEKKH